MEAGRLAASAARGAGRVRSVLKRVRGGVMTRHMEEVSICAPAITARCHTGEAACGLLGGSAHLARVLV